jgi:hypothetical protein
MSPYTFSTSGFQLAGSLPSLVSPAPFQAQLAGSAGQMTPGYTGGFDYTTIPGIDPSMAGLFRFQENRDERERTRQLEDWERVRQQRSEEGKEAAKIKMLTALPGQILQGFESIARLSYPAAAIEIQSRTPALLANMYSNNPYANRKWLS